MSISGSGTSDTTSSAAPGKPVGGGMIDPRGPRFGAAITTAVLVIILLTDSGWLAVAQTVVFALGAGLGLRYAPYGLIYRTFVQKRLPKPTELEHEAPPRFAQGVGFVFVAVGAVALLAGATVIGIVATALALAAAFLNAAFDYCVGCEMYLLLRRLTSH
jgi:Domain of unknown function (DUF4395)